MALKIFKLIQGPLLLTACFILFFLAISDGLSGFELCDAARCYTDYDEGLPTVWRLFILFDHPWGAALFPMLLLSLLWGLVGLIIRRNRETNFKIILYSLVVFVAVFICRVIAINCIYSSRECPGSTYKYRISSTKR